MKRKTRTELYILLVMIALLTRLSITSICIRNENDGTKQAKPAIVSISSVNTDLIDCRKADNSSIHAVKIDTSDGVKSADTYIIIIFALYFILNNPPPHIDKILHLISTIHFNVGKYKKYVNTF